MSAAGRAGIRRSLKLLAGTACLLPGLAPAAGPFEGTWQMQSGATTFGEEHPLELMLERGEFQRAGCTPAIDVAADGSDQPVRGQPLFDSMAVKIVAPLRVEVTQKLAGKLVWKGSYTVAKDQKSLVFDFDEEHASTPVTGSIEYARIGEPLAGAHAVSGKWQAKKLTQISASGQSMTIVQSAPSLTMSWSDGRSVQSPLDAKYYPVDGYTPGAKASILNSRPDMLAVNRLQGTTPVEVLRVFISVDSESLTVKQVDWLCRNLTTYTYSKKHGS